MLGEISILVHFPLKVSSCYKYKLKEGNKHYLEVNGSEGFHDMTDVHFKLKYGMTNLASMHYERVRDFSQFFLSLDNMGMPFFLQIIISFVYHHYEIKFGMQAMIQ